jgi:bisanhydrobacterioruberin hydratase
MNPFNQISATLKSQFTAAVWFFVIFYLVGIVGMLLPVSFSLFTRLIPLALLLSTFGFLLFHPNYTTKTWLLFIILYLAGFFIEVAGVNTGIIFGYYTYGESLGFSVINTPLIIGVNWLLLVYLSSSVVEKLNVNNGIKVVLASIIMLVYDIIIEPVAPRLDMWTWANNEIPLRNYLAWFVLALIFTSLVKIFGVKTRNKLAPVLLACQLLFFIVLRITFYFQY